MRLAIVGSREITDPNVLLAALKKVPSLWSVTEIVSGGARGIDSLAKSYAEANGLKLTEFRPDYGKYGRGATLQRNTEIISYADIVLAIPLKGQSKGTYDDIRKAQSMGKRLYIHEVTAIPSSPAAANTSLKIDLQSEVPFKTGEKVQHDKFGIGIITKVDGAKLEIDFGETGTKTISGTYKGLKKENI